VNYRLGESAVRFLISHASERYAGDEVVTCVIPGHDQSGEELVAEELTVEDGPFAFSYSGVCGYGAATFDYAG